MGLAFKPNVDDLRVVAKYIATRVMQAHNDGDFDRRTQYTGA